MAAYMHQHAPATCINSLFMVQLPDLQAFSGAFNFSPEPAIHLGQVNVRSSPAFKTCGSSAARITGAVVPVLAICIQVEAAVQILKSPGLPEISATIIQPLS